MSRLRGSLGDDRFPKLTPWATWMSPHPRLAFLVMTVFPRLTPLATSMSPHPRLAFIGMTCPKAHALGYLDFAASAARFFGDDRFSQGSRLGLLGFRRIRGSCSGEASGVFELSATRDPRPATCDLRPATCDLRPGTRDPRPARYSSPTPWRSSTSSSFISPSSVSWSWPRAWRMPWRRR